MTLPTQCTPDERASAYGHVWRYADDGVHLGPPEGLPCVCGTVLAPPSLTYDEAIETMVLEGLMTRLCVNPSP
jgi:hypothetical protein